MAACLLVVVSAAYSKTKPLPPPPPPNPDMVKNADFGPAPTDDQLKAATMLWGLKSNFAQRFGPTKLSGIPRKAFLFQPGGGGTYQFGWEQELAIDGYTMTGIYMETLYMYIFFKDGAPTYHSLHVDKYESKAGNCMVRQNEKTCSQLGSL
jgi:hypothetical protein